MPMCQGMPDGPCPAGRNDSKVRLGEGDLMLCGDCDKARFNMFVEAKKGRSTGKIEADNSNPIVNNSHQEGGAGTSSTKADTAINQKKNQIRNPVKSVHDLNASSVYANTTGGSIGTESTNVHTSSDQNFSVVVNELLSYVSFYRDRAAADNLRKLIINFYGAGEISAAKRQLINCFSVSLADCPYKADRRKSSSRLVYEAETDDILAMMSYLDNKALLSYIKFAAVDHDRIPKYGPEDLNICSIADKQQEMSVKLSELNSHVDNIDTRVVDAVQQAVLSVQGQLHDLSEVTKSILATSSLINTTNDSSTTSPTSSSRHVDRSHNIVISGVEENRDHTVWRDNVLNILRTAAGRDVHIEDAFRLGAYQSSKKRPILVKFRSIWDRRLVLSGARNLNDDILFRRKVFINADEPPEERRRNTLRRLKRRAESSGQQVDVTSDGILIIDGTACFSVRDGFLNRQVLVSSRGIANDNVDMSRPVASPRNG